VPPFEFSRRIARTLHQRSSSFKNESLKDLATSSAPLTGLVLGFRTTTDC
jgi:hypothetical protein